MPIGTSNCSNVAQYSFKRSCTTPKLEDVDPNSSATWHQRRSPRGFQAASLAKLFVATVVVDHLGIYCKHRPNTSHKATLITRKALYSVN